MFQTLTSEVFGMVEPGVYRSNSTIFPCFVKFKTVLLLSPELSKLQAQSFVDAKVNFIHLGLQSLTGGKLGTATSSAGLPGVASSSSFTSMVGQPAAAIIAPTSWRPVSDEVIKEGLQIALNADTYPLLICCTSGVFETGVLVGCLRKLQGWNFNSIVVEYRYDAVPHDRSWAGSKCKYGVEQFIELFDTDLVTMPQTLPSWFRRHETSQDAAEPAKDEPGPLAPLHAN
ncbi:hypothetical protein HDV03_000167 [Kappamyces sp. JEL0829]|nr:hypothetical protein HDV03_000167 [Kappamyces sp. JEL0829]